MLKMVLNYLRLLTEFIYSRRGQSICVANSTIDLLPEPH